MRVQQAAVSEHGVLRCHQTAFVAFVSLQDPEVHTYFFLDLGHEDGGDGRG